MGTSHAITVKKCASSENSQVPGRKLSAAAIGRTLGIGRRRVDRLARKGLIISHLYGRQRRYELTDVKEALFKLASTAKAFRRRAVGLFVAAVASCALSSCGRSPTAPDSAGGMPERGVAAPAVEQASLSGESEAPTAKAGVMASSSAAAVDGWCSQTGYRCAETALQTRIVDRARSASGSSGRSVIGSPWLTDAAGGDGLRMRTAIKRYMNWTRAAQPKVSQVEIERQMRNDFAATYDSSQQSAFVARIKARTRIYPPNFIGPLPGVPVTDQGGLDYLDVQAQCKEWADRIVQQAGGRTSAYTSGRVVSGVNARPGMGFYKLDASHAALIIDVRWLNGSAVEFRLAEANMGGGWPKNPPGQVPWERTVRTDRRVPLAGYKVVSFE